LIHLFSKDGFLTCLSNKGSTGIEPF